MSLISEPLGRVLGNRYRLVSTLGTGASAHVFLAEDMVLARRVAVKVLQPALARDEAFLRRFRAEARSVAAMNHPYVLRVFDWGEDEDGPFLVLEYLEGGSLYDMLSRGARLTPAQAARIGVQAAEGLAYAHARGLVHRDVKPANVLFDEEGRVRMADFGVARALAGVSLTEPVGTMVGTVRYASPEQAQGRPLDGRSDVYSLGLVLYESVTGKVPFTGDTPAATLMARVGAALPRQLTLGPLYDTVAWAASPDTEARPDAASLALRLETVADDLPPPRPLPLARRHAAPVAATGPSPAVGTGPAPPPGSRGGGFGDTTGVLQLGAGAGADGPPTAAVPALEANPTAMMGLATGGNVPGLGGRSPRGPAPVRGRRRAWGWITAVVVVVAAIVAAGVVYAVKKRVFTPSHPVPSLVGKPLSAVRSSLAADHFTLVVQPAVHSVTVPSGAVVTQSPRKGTSLKQGSTVTVVPSSGPPDETIPSLKGDITCTAAVRLLAQVHLKALCPALLAYTGTVPKGDVINWSYTGAAGLDPTTAPYGTTINIAISKGRAPVKVPGFTGQTYTQAVVALRGLGLTANEVQAFSTTVPPTQVVSTTPPAGTTVFPGSAVTVTVSKGPHLVTVPDLKTKTVAQATAALQKVGLTVGLVYGPATGKVFTTVPLAGSAVHAGSSVVLYTQ